MVERVRVFVSYKKVVSRHVKGRTVPEASTEASLFAHILNGSSQYEAWVDQDETKAGMEWETEIFTRLVASDAVLLLVGPGTSQSEWVKREIALANALGISIVPIGFELNEEQLVAELRSLALGHIQGRVTNNIRLSPPEPLLEELKRPARWRSPVPPQGTNNQSRLKDCRRGEQLEDSRQTTTRGEFRSFSAPAPWE
jgi:TIR domain